MDGRKKRPPLYKVTSLKATYVKPDIIRTETSAQAKLRLIEQKLGNYQDAEKNEGGVWLREKAGIMYRTSCDALGLRDLAAMPELGVCLPSHPCEEKESHAVSTTGGLPARKATTIPGNRPYHPHRTGPPAAESYGY